MKFNPYIQTTVVPLDVLGYGFRTDLDVAIKVSRCTPTEEVGIQKHMLLIGNTMMDFGQNLNQGYEGTSEEAEENHNLIGRSWNLWKHDQ